MEKKDLKWYEAPAVEVVEMESAASLLAGSITEGGDPSSPGGGEWDD